jgi:hypothetical protein
MKYAKIKDNPSLLRDMDSNAVISTDNAALAAYKTSKRKMQSIDEIKKDNESLQQKVARLESKLDYLVSVLERNK